MIFLKNVKIENNYLYIFYSTFQILMDLQKNLKSYRSLKFLNYFPLSFFCQKRVLTVFISSIWKVSIKIDIKLYYIFYQLPVAKKINTFEQKV